MIASAFSFYQKCDCNIKTSALLQTSPKLIWLCWYMKPHISYRFLLNQMPYVQKEISRKYRWQKLDKYKQNYLKNRWNYRYSWKTVFFLILPTFSSVYNFYKVKSSELKISMVGLSRGKWAFLEKSAEVLHPSAACAWRKRRKNGSTINHYCKISICIICVSEATSFLLKM